MAEMCENCRFSEHYLRHSIPDAIQCRRYPERSMHSENSWCGEWQAKPDTAVTPAGHAEIAGTVGVTKES